MKNLILIVVSLLWIGCGLDKKQYLDENFLPTSKDGATYYRIVEDNINSENTKMVMDYYVATNSLQFKGSMSDISKDTFEGTCVWYHPNGEKSSIGFYENGESVGYHKIYDKAGKILSESFTNSNGEISEEIFYYPKTEMPMLELYLFEDGTTKQIYNYENGQKFAVISNEENIESYYENGDPFVNIYNMTSNECSAQYFYPNGIVAHYFKGIPYEDYFVGKSTDNFVVILKDKVNKTQLHIVTINGKRNIISRGDWSVNEIAKRELVISEKTKEIFERTERIFEEVQNIQQKIETFSEF